MRERIRLVVAACFYYTGLVGLAHWWWCRFHPHLIILNYHRATGNNLRLQLRYLQRHYRIQHLEQALEELASSPQTSMSGDLRLPLALTFDDGYRDNYSYAFALARELQIPLTIFLIPGYIESGACFWWLASEQFVRASRVDKVIIEEQTYRLGVPTERQALIKAIDTHLRYAKSVAERQQFLATIRKELALDTLDTVSDLLTQTDKDALPMTWEQVHEMEQSGLVSYGAHTMHHPVLAYLADTQELRQEVMECRRVLEDRLGHPVRTFAYPIGKQEHIGDEVVSIVQEAGYQWAVTTIEDVNTDQTDHFLLRRLPGDLDQHWLIMASELVGLLGLSRFRSKDRAKFSR